MIAPSLLSADFLSLRETVEMVNKSDADWLHLDIMDGLFVPNITFGFQIIKQIKSISEKPLDVHLMIVKPERFIKRFAGAGADIITVHYEACPHLHRIVEEIRNEGIKAGVSLNPHSPVSLATPIIEYIDLLLIMSVNPGFGGQKFIQSSYNKISSARELINQKNKKCLIEVDGGVDLHNAEKLYLSGADVLVAGNSVFGSNNPLNMISQIRQKKN